MSKAPNAEANAAQQSIDELTKRYQQLNGQKIRAETNLENTKQQLDKLQKEAREKYGTDDVAELRKKLGEMTAENETKRSNYQRDLDKIEKELQQVEEKFATAEPGEGERA